MTRPAALLALLASAAVAVAADPPKPLAPADADKLAVDALRGVHDTGADLYNAADPGGAFRLYQGGLAGVKPFLAHRPAVQKAIDDGLAEADKADGLKAKAFRLHELIETVRADLRKDDGGGAATIPKADPGDKPMTTPKPKDPPKATDKPAETKEPPPTTTPNPPPPAKGETLIGTLALDDKPLAGCTLAFASVGKDALKTLTATTDKDGGFKLADPVPAGEYTVALTAPAGVTLPAKYLKAETSGLKVVVKAGENKVDLKLQSK